ncbi:MAG: hypothetical protein KJS68_11600 [Alphaproteobacteria bacterium]|nr:hypothetical protein [Alphaproteobacteria bacterium]
MSFAAKPAHKPLPLWLLFIAVQWLDICWSVLVMLGIEKLHVVKGFTQGSDLDLYYMPYTHGLIGALGLSAMLGGVSAQFFKKRRMRVFWIVAACVFSHWLLDLVVHVPDLPLIGDSDKVGFGLWRNVAISFPLEMLVLWAGAFVYARSLPSTRSGDFWLWTFVTALSALQVYGTFGPAPTDPIAEAHLALIAYVILALLAGLVGWQRTATATSRPALTPFNRRNGGKPF